MKQFFPLLLFVGVCICIYAAYLLVQKFSPSPAKQKIEVVTPTPSTPYSGLQISAMRQKTYPGSAITIEQTLPNGNNYKQYLTSYQSEGNKIYALMTLPMGEKPKNGWPVIIFNHGYIAPKTYQTFPSSGQYASYYPPIAEDGYIVFKPDYRGNGNSEGQPEGAYYSPAYATDVLNAVASIKKYQDANPNKIGMWGHSMGGNITLRDIVVNKKDIKAAVIWGGVVGSYMDLEHWHDPNYHPSAYELSLRYRYRANLEKTYGTPEKNPLFWNSIDPTYFLQDITTPLQIHAGEDDEEVPAAFSENLYTKLKKLGKTTELYTYPGDNHNISGNFSLAMQRSLAFYDKYLK